MSVKISLSKANSGSVVIAIKRADNMVLEIATDGIANIKVLPPEARVLPAFPMGLRPDLSLVEQVMQEWLTEAVKQQ